MKKLDIINFAHDVVDQLFLEDSYSLFDIENIISQDGIDIKLERNNKNDFFKYRALIEINEMEKTIFLYEDSIEEICSKFELDYEFVKCILLTHEFFHYLEYKNIVNTDYFIHRKSILKVKRRYKVKAASEIAANYFIIKVLGLDFNPLIFDIEESNV